MQIFIKKICFAGSLFSLAAVLGVFLLAGCYQEEARTGTASDTEPLGGDEADPAGGEAEGGLPRYRILTENYPPFNYVGAEGEIAGVSAEVVRRMCRRVGHPAEFELLPWSRGYNTALKEEGVMLFSTARTEAREDLFRWVGPLVDYQVVFFAWEDRWREQGFPVESLGDLKKAELIGSGLNTSTGQELEAEGFENLDLVANSSLNAGKLADGRIDLWLSGRLSGIHRAKQQGIDPSQLEVVFRYRREDLCLAFSRETPDWVIEEWQGALDRLKEEGVYGEILQEYLE